uniref:Uncharacterized protein n=1 Tax=Avena sativa TaxID=4498 RepID=A0ACD5YNH5_AVESA
MADDNHNGGSGAEAPPAAKGSATISITIVLLVLLVASVAAFLMSSPPGGKTPVEGPGVGGSSRSGAEPVEHAVGHGIPGFNSRLDAFRAWAKLTWMKLQRPRSDSEDEPRYDGGGIAGSAAEAAKKTMEMGKETAERAGEAVAGAAEDAVGMAKDTVKA